MRFTPIDERTGERLELDIEDAVIPRGSVVTFNVVEKSTGKEYRCKTTSCGLSGCICDARIFHYGQ